MNFKRYFLLVFVMSNFLNAQQNYFESVIKDLTSDKYNGRGYTYGGMLKASQYLGKEFKKIGLNPIDKTYFQEVEFPINIIEDATLVINGEILVYGKDFIVKPSSKSIQLNQSLENYIFPINDYVKSFQSKDEIRNFIASDYQNQNGRNIILPPIKNALDSIKTYYKQWANTYEKDENKNRAIFRFVSDSLTASLSQRQANVTEFIIKEKYYNDNLSLDSFSVSANFNPQFKFNNIIGYLNGENNDSVIVVSAHYDHLGRVGNSIFPGASDNASGTAMVLDLAKYFSKHKPKYKMVFMLFGAEEAGIVGALNYVKNPMFPLEKIKFLVNLDIMGAGEDGVQVVNGTKFKTEFDKLVKINKEKSLLKEIKIRGESCNSDHCPFYEKGVPSFFIYTLGGKGNYHNIYDTYDNLNLKFSPQVKQLLIQFINQL